MTSWHLSKWQISRAKEYHAEMMVLLREALKEEHLVGAALRQKSRIVLKAYRGYMKSIGKALNNLKI